MNFIKPLLFLGMACALQAMNMHWQIDWQSQSNLLSSSYISKKLIPKLIKFDGILKKKIGALDSEIQVNFMILMGISALMSVMMVMTAHTCYLSCKQKVDKVVPKTQPNISRLPVIQNQHVPVVTSTSQNKELELQTTPTTQNWIGCPYKSWISKCKNMSKYEFKNLNSW